MDAVFFWGGKFLEEELSTFPGALLECLLTIVVSVFKGKFLGDWRGADLERTFF